MAQISGPTDLSDPKFSSELSWKKFIIPPKLLEAPPTDPSTSSKPCLILKLPSEILVDIFDAASPVDGICLALTCKTLLQASSLTTLERPRLERPGWGPYWRRCRALTGLSAQDLMINFMNRIQPLGLNGRPKKSLALCLECFRFRPTRPNYWKGEGRKCPNDDSHEAHESEGSWEIVLRDWKKKGGLLCPACWFKQHQSRYGPCDPRWE